MSSSLAKIQIHPGRKVEFEDVMSYTYRQTHGSIAALDLEVIDLLQEQEQEQAQCFPITAAAWWRTLRS